MRRLFTKEQIFTIPNLLSLIRFLMIPVIIWLYCFRGAYYQAVAVILLSGLTDVIDGFIARKFKVVSDLGKILDPVADKLTQFAILVCLTVKHKLMLLLVILFSAMELCKSLLGYLAIRKEDSVNSSKWHGKLNTVMLYATMVLLILFPQMPEFAANGLIVLCVFVMTYSFANYAVFYYRLFQKKNG